VGAIELEGVSMWRRTQEELAYDLKRIVLQSLERRYRPPAQRRILRNIDFTIESGEKVGIIGPNGAGKSTLLKLICGILRPTSGRVSVTGRIAPLIELGAGFDLDLSIIENVIYYGVLLGFSRTAMRERVAPILDFAELTEYGHAPLKTLSSGMAARLGFAVATDQRPDIFILDEVLSVGDEHFKRKSMARIAEFWDAHSTILVVSHDIEFVASQCERAIWIDHGSVVAAGPAPAVCESYLASVVAEAPVPEMALPESIKFNIERVTHAGTPVVAFDRSEPLSVAVNAGEAVTIEGWSLDAAAQRGARMLVFEAGACSARVRCEIARPDVAQAFAAPSVEVCGFLATLPTGGLVAGPHDVALRIFTGPGEAYRIPTVLRLEVAAPAR
jgi:ABC-2 type transport system ATP-binding protein